MMQTEVQKQDPSEYRIIAVRIPARLHKRLKFLAVKQERTLEQLYADAIKLFLETQ